MLEMSVSLNGSVPGLHAYTYIIFSVMTHCINWVFFETVHTVKFFNFGS